MAPNGDSPLHAPLLAWFEANKRDLPWRRTKDPYAIWVSEVMLQQTQVATVIPYFERWMARFPTVACLAAASEDEVLALWQGLGYYRRARSLLAGAISWERQRLAGIPEPAGRRRSQLLEIPGIGPYTAGAIASIAFDEPAPLVDGNVERVFSRLTGCDASGPALNKLAWNWASFVIHQTQPGDWNQALMELGATVCTPVAPRCGDCPLQNQCEAFRTGRQAELPVSPPKKKTVSLTHHVWIPVCGDTVGLRQVPTGEWWAGMWEFARSSSLDELAALFPDAWPEEAGRFRHSVTHHRIHVHVSLVRVQAPAEGFQWVKLADLHKYALPSPQRKALQLVKTTF